MLVVLLLQACIPPPTPAAPTLTPVPPTATAIPPTPTPSIEPVSPWWTGAVFYEAFVRSFYDSNGDGIGDFNGLTAKLDYLNDGNPATKTDLGITALWLMPIFPSPSYHGYDVTDYYAVNPQYGTMDEFKKMLSEAHRRGIKVIIDLVINHTSIDHPWFQAAVNGDPKYKDYYIWSDTDPGYGGPDGQQVWYKAGNGKYYYAVFWSRMPDLNLKNPAVTEEINKIGDFWQKEVGVDGFRVDGAKHLIEEGTKQVDTDSTHAWLKGFFSHYKANSAEAMSVGEAWTNSFEAVRYVKDKNFDLVFNFDLARGLMSAISNRDAAKLGNTVPFEANLFRNGGMATFLTNHDQNRVMSQFGKETDKAKLAAAMLLTMPGTPFIYYGEEIGMTGTKPDEMIRTPMQWDATTRSGFTTGDKAWNAVNSDYDQRNVATQSANPDSLLSLYRDLIDARLRHPALRSGSLVKMTTENNRVFAMLRTTDAETVLVVLNLSTETIKDYSLAAGEGMPDGTYQPGIIYGKGDLADLTVSGGKFSGYKPLNELPAGGIFVIKLR